jgi:lipoprotein
MSKTSSKLNPQRIAIAISAGIGILACFMPWTSFPIIGTVNGASGDGLIYAGLLAIPLLFVLLGDKTKKIEKQVKVANILIGILVIFCGIFVEIANFDYKIKTAKQVSNRRISNSSYISKGDAENISNAMISSAKIEFGLYLLIISSISVVVCSGVDSLFQNSTDKKKVK